MIALETAAVWPAFRSQWRNWGRVGSLRLLRDAPFTRGTAGRVAIHLYHTIAVATSLASLKTYLLTALVGMASFYRTAVAAR